MWLVRGVAFASLLALFGPSVPSPQDVDPAAFVMAFQSGAADQYKGRTIAGTGVAFGVGGPWILITLGAVGDDKRVVPLTTREAFSAARAAHTTLQLFVSAPDFDSKSLTPRDLPAQFSFSGVYNGRMRTAWRPESGLADTGPCPPQPDDPKNLHVITNGPSTAYCVPLLESGTLQKK
jgi:hypothetical protein